MTIHDEKSVIAQEQTTSQDIRDSIASTGEPAKLSRAAKEREEREFREKLLAALNRIAVALEMLERR